MGFPGGQMAKKTSAILRDIRYKPIRDGIFPWIGKIHWSRKWQPTLIFLRGKPHGQRSLAGYSSWGCKESDWAVEYIHRQLLHMTCILGRGQCQFKPLQETEPYKMEAEEAKLHSSLNVQQHMKLILTVINFIMLYLILYTF